MSLPNVPPGYPPPPVAVAPDVVYTVLDAAGEVLRVLSTASPEQLAANIPLGCSCISGLPPSARPSDSYRQGSAWVAKPAKPSKYHTWNSPAKAWTDPRSFEELKAAAWEAIKADRAAAIDAPLTTPFGTFDSNSDGRRNIADLVLMLNNTATPPVIIDFTLADNSTATLTPAQMVSVGLLLGQKVQGAHATARILRAQIAAASTPGQLTSIKWPKP